MPALAVKLTLRHVTSQNKDGVSEDLVSFLTGQLLGNNAEVTSWFSQYIKNSQKVRFYFKFKAALGLNTNFQFNLNISQKLEEG